ncbi:hypothetical protein FKG94_03695 [Exilibacterium tricleocarpae]|uniref:Uncharacterized protein n=2 Tax=Exilibacterium tricleocarpae TaxID=2591008 RepID=A0A545U5U6_9GAMM|nr:hypothetical protein FKG94_03695 [Exilibacterium tricleocarpae]
MVPALLLLLGGCTNTLVVQGEFPSPQVNQLPITLAVHYDEAFRGHTYEEKSKDRSKWVITSGPAQMQLFNRVLPQMFEAVVEVSEIPPAEAEVDLILAPAIKEFQYAVPRETKVNVFEVWIKFNMQVFDKNGELIADWILPAYGKTPTAFLKSKEEAMNEAVVVALRDIGASLSLGFTRVPEIRAWLEQHQRAML